MVLFSEVANENLLILKVFLMRDVDVSLETIKFCHSVSSGSLQHL